MKKVLLAMAMITVVTSAQTMAEERIPVVKLMEMAAKTMPIAMITVGTNIHCNENDKEYQTIKTVLDMAKSKFDPEHMKLYNKQVSNFTKMAIKDNIQSIGCTSYIEKMNNLGSKKVDK